EDNIEANQQVDEIENSEENQLYGFKTDSFVVLNSEIKKNQNLSEILAPNNVSFTDIEKLSNDYKEVFDVRKLRPGKKYTLLLSQDTVPKAQYFIYESSATEYVVCSFNDSVSACRMTKDVDTVLTHVSGIITSSLYESILDNGGDPELAILLSEMYAWEIDFFRLQKNDKFKVIYKQLMVDGKPVGIDHIVAANFNHMNNDFLGFRYLQDDNYAYFDESANSLQKEFLKAPLRFSRISSRFSRRRFHPVQKRYKAHLGTDYAAPRGTPIVTVGDGIVTEARYKRNNGNYVKIKHNGTFTTQYLHMSKIAKGIKPGQKVTQGQVIGYVGSTGLATGPHLCYRFWKNGQQVDGTKVKIPPSKPIQKEYLSDYYAAIRPWALALDKISYPEVNKEPAEPLADK
ncbi:MAG: peptidoglycan DD-metalloendopeptidase family protein, partial [Bacteroidia bacterium]|nr:peptidoglycan DD-metalloendopeptidase family protein [Bacteroidia bacterium]